jgi:hypothetical protein
VIMFSQQESTGNSLGLLIFLSLHGEYHEI